MKFFKQAIMFASVPALLVATSSAFAIADTTIIDGISAEITNAGDTAKAVVLLLVVASVIVMGALWAWSMVKKGKSA